MLGKLDVEKKESASDDTHSQGQQGWNKHLFGKALIAQGNKSSSRHQYQPHDYLTLQLCICKNVFLSHQCQKQSAKKHRIDGERMWQRQIEARYHHDAYNIDEQRKSLRQEETVATDE